MSRFNRLTRGFTLLEIMIVVVLMALAVTVVTSIGSADDPYEDLEKEAVRLMRVVELSQQEAMLSGQMYALLMKQGSYQAYHVKQTSFIEALALFAGDSDAKEELAESDELGADGTYQIQKDIEVKPIDWEPLEEKAFQLHEPMEGMGYQVKLGGLLLDEQEEDGSDTSMLQFQKNFESKDGFSREPPPTPILFFPSGDMSKFDVTISYQDSKQYYSLHVVGDMVGRTKIAYEELKDD